MARRLLLATFLSGFLLVSTAAAAPITFSGTVTYDGSHSADSLYVIVIDWNGGTTFGFVGLAAGPPPFSIPYSVEFDNSAAPPPVLLVAALDVDGSGVSPDSLDSVANSDIVGWFDGHIDPVPLGTDSSQSMLDFALPTGEIHGNVTFAPNQSWAAVQPFSIPNSWSPVTFHMAVSGSYEIFGLYAGDWKVRAESALGNICYGDPDCVAPTIITLTPGEIRTGVDFDFLPLSTDAPFPPVTPASWGMVKRLYR